MKMSITRRTITQSIRAPILAARREWKKPHTTQNHALSSRPLIARTKANRPPLPKTRKKLQFGRANLKTPLTKKAEKYWAWKNKKELSRVVRPATWITRHQAERSLDRSSTRDGTPSGHALPHRPPALPPTGRHRSTLQCGPPPSRCALSLRNLLRRGSSPTRRTQVRSQ